MTPTTSYPVDRPSQRQVHGIEVGEAASLRGAQYSTMDEKPPLSNADDQLVRRKWVLFTPRFRIRPRLFIACCMLLILLTVGLSPSAPTKGPKEHSKFGAVKAKAGLVKDDEAASTASTATAASPTSTGVQEVFQVYQPVLIPDGATDETTLSDGSENTTALNSTAASTSCQQVLMEYSFGSSYGVPFVGNYTPPNCNFNRVVMNFTVTSRGRQFDRLALMYFGDTEVFRTSTAEPTTAGIKWTYMKDMSEFMYFWNTPQKVIFDLGNIIDSNYTGPYNTTLTATFFTSDDTPKPAAMIIPVSARKGATNGASVFILPSVNATNTVSLPRNINRAVFSVSACGQADEEFWWSNVFQSNILTFNATAGKLNGYSPFREVQVFIDGQMAGVSWPFPVIFTGGVVPGLWRPIVGIDAFDLREHEIDITPWLAMLCDGESHTFEIKVAGVMDDGKSNGTLTQTVGSSWYVTGKIFLWLDSDANSITTGKAPTILLPEPVITISQALTQNSTGANETLVNNISVKRSLSVSGSVTTQNGTKLSSWTQTLSFFNDGAYSDFGQVQVNNISTDGLDQSTGPTYYKCSYSYPLWANTSSFTQPSGNYTLGADIQRGLVWEVDGLSVFPTGIQPFNFSNTASEGLSSSTSYSGTLLSTSQNGSATYFASPSTNFSSTFGTTGQTFSFTGIDTEGGIGNKQLYYRDVLAVNGTVRSDQEMLVGNPVANYVAPIDSVGSEQRVLSLVAGVRGTLGRGQGDSRQSLVSGNGGES